MGGPGIENVGNSVGYKKCFGTPCLARTYRYENDPWKFLRVRTFTENPIFTHGKTFLRLVVGMGYQGNYCTLQPGVSGKPGIRWDIWAQSDISAPYVATSGGTKNSPEKNHILRNSWGIMVTLGGWSIPWATVIHKKILLFSLQKIFFLAFFKFQ